MIGLRSLEISEARMDDLPVGPYLSRLEELYMSHCIFQSGLPAALASATQLHSLDMAFCDGILLGAGDMAVLSSLTALTSLALHLPDAEDAAGSEERLQALWVAKGRAPPYMSIILGDG